MIRKIKKEIELNGITKTIQKAVQKIVGVWDMREEIDTLHYFLNACHDASCMPPATDPDLRILQLCDVQLLRIVAKLCDKLELSYWLDFGTLLGAVRHHGFIPWDDDMDVAMPRNDFNRALSELKNELMNYDIDLCEENQIGIGYHHKETGIWLDIFAHDEYFYSKDNIDLYKISTDIDKCRNNYLHHISKASQDWKYKNRMKYIGVGEGPNKMLYLQPEFKYLKNIFHPSDIVFPLSELKFEGYDFKVPQDYISYLKVIYGKDFMSFPRKGILKHDAGRGPLSTWAKKNGVNMNVVLDKLSSIADKI